MVGISNDLVYVWTMPSLSVFLGSCDIGIPASLSTFSFAANMTCLSTSGVPRESGPMSR